MEPSLISEHTWLRAPSEIEELTSLYARAQRVLRASGLDYAQTQIIEAVTAANRALASADVDVTSQQAALSILARRIETISGYIERSEQENARRRYIRGLAWGVWLSLLILAIIAVVARPLMMAFMSMRSAPPILAADDYYALRDVLVCLAGGAAGATVSVLLRLSREKFSFDTVNNGAAIYRIMLGWLFAAAAIFLVKGGIVTIFKVPETTLAQWFFWGSLGFLAGFNERWATSLISREPPKESETESNPDPENNDPAHSKRAADDNHVDGAAAEVKLVKDTPATQPDAPNEPFRRGSPRSVVRYALLFRRSQ